jgi:YD repeat-containing protein
VRQGGGNFRPGRVSDPDGKTSRVVARPHRARKQTLGAALRAADTRKIPIDPNGNLASKVEGTDTWGYEWNVENRLTRVTSRPERAGGVDGCPAWGRRAACHPL